MEWVIVAFRSRSHTVKFSNLLGQMGIPNQIVNTPKEAGVGCGLSLKIKKGYVYVVNGVLMKVGKQVLQGAFW
jgi:hypothetical protein